MRVLFLESLISDHNLMKLILWICLGILAVYIFVLEGRIIFTRMKIEKAINRVRKQKVIQIKSEIDSNQDKLQLDQKEVKILVYLFAVMFLLTLILTFTY